VTVALTGCFTGGSDERTNVPPGVTAFACVSVGVSDRAFGIRSRQHSSAKSGERHWVDSSVADAS
jgi:hypothetical protein